MLYKNDPTNKKLANKPARKLCMTISKNSRSWQVDCYSCVIRSRNKNLSCEEKMPCFRLVRSLVYIPNCMRKSKNTKPSPSSVAFLTAVASLPLSGLVRRFLQSFETVHSLYKTASNDFQDVSLNENCSRISCLLYSSGQLSYCVVNM